MSTSSKRKAREEEERLLTSQQMFNLREEIGYQQEEIRKLEEHLRTVMPEDRRSRVLTRLAHQRSLVARLYRVERMIEQTAVRLRVTYQERLQELNNRCNELEAREARLKEKEKEPKPPPPLSAKKAQKEAMRVMLTNSRSTRISVELRNLFKQEIGEELFQHLLKRATEIVDAGLQAEPNDLIPVTMGKVHLRKTELDAGEVPSLHIANALKEGLWVACKQIVPDRRRVTDDPAQVTCNGCLATLAPPPAVCPRIQGLPVTVVVEMLTPPFGGSPSQFYAPNMGTMGRTGFCGTCDAAIYRREGMTGRFPHNLEGPYYHAVAGGLVALPYTVPEEVKPFLQELERSERGLDCAGQSGEAAHMEGYIQDIKLGYPWQDVWKRMQERYAPANQDLLDSFAKVLPPPPGLLRQGGTANP